MVHAFDFIRRCTRLISLDGARTVSTFYLIPITYYLLPITYYLLPSTFYLLLSSGLFEVCGGDLQFHTGVDVFGVRL